MQRDPREEGERWLDQVREDLRSADLLLGEGRYYLVCFLAQQVAEKTLKAYLYATGAEPVFDHSIQRLGGRIADRDAALTESVAAAAELDAYYVQTRYPDALPTGVPAGAFDKDDADRALDLARGVLAAVQRNWPQAGGS